MLVCIPSLLPLYHISWVINWLWTFWTYITVQLISIHGIFGKFNILRLLKPSWGQTLKICLLFWFNLFGILCVLPRLVHLTLSWLPIFHEKIFKILLWNWSYIFLTLNSLHAQLTTFHLKMLLSLCSCLWCECWLPLAQCWSLWQCRLTPISMQLWSCICSISWLFICQNLVEF